MAAASGPRPDAAGSRTAVPVVRARSRGRGWHGAKLTVGLAVLGVVAVASAVAGFQALRAIGEGDGVTAADEYLAGGGVEYENDIGRFRVEFPSDPESGTNTDRITIFGGDVDIEGVDADLRDANDTRLHVSWFDLPNSPEAESVTGLLNAIAVFHAAEFDAAPAAGAPVESSRYPAYEYELELESEDTSNIDPVSTFLVARLVLVDARVYVLWIESMEPARELLAHLADTFEPLQGRRET